VTFNAAAVSALFSAAISQAQSLGIFARVNGHEPKSAPGTQLSCSFWGGGIKPAATASGLGAVSGVVTLNARIYSSFVAKPEDGIDPHLLAAGCALMAAYSGGFTLGGTVRDIDLLGEFGEALSGQMAYLEQDGKLFRVFDLVIPVVINDLWTEAA
jgi:hypothetical protein